MWHKLCHITKLCQLKTCFIYQAYSLIRNSFRHFFHLFVGNMLLFFLVVLQIKVSELLAWNNEPFLTNSPASTTRTSALYWSICVHIFKAAKFWTSCLYFWRSVDVWLLCTFYHLTSSQNSATGGEIRWSYWLSQLKNLAQYPLVYWQYSKVLLNSGVFG